LETLYKENPHYKTIHLFLTDGEPTAGSTNFSTLVNLINPDYSTVFIGYGSDHNSKLLSAFSKKGIQNKYMFVDNFENTGLVYGEIVYSLLYSGIENVTIHMSEGSYIYDAATNSWNQTLSIPVLLSEKENIYHIKTTNKDNVVATIYGTILNELENNLTILSGESEMICVVENLPDLIEEDGNIVEIDLSKYIFRQKTMELLYEASNLNINENYIQLKNKMKEFFKKMSIFMEQNNLKDDCFMKVLCEDIHISYTTLGSSDGIMFSESRNISQRDQSCYRSGSEIKRHRPNIFGNAPKKNKLIRTNYIYQNYDDYINVDDTDENDDNDDSHDISNNVNILRYNNVDLHNIDNYNSEFIKDDIYSTQDAISIIRGVSGL
jgi:hypothetical protein